MKHFLGVVHVLGFCLASVVFAQPAQNLPEIAIMGYNLENLHDVAHDEGKDDWLWLPKDFPGSASIVSV